VIDRRVEPFLLDAESRRCIALGIQIGDEGRTAREGEAGGKTNCRRRLAYAALLVDDG
jgi:hypothetical protein